MGECYNVSSIRVSIISEEYIAIQGHLMDMDRLISRVRRFVPERHHFTRELAALQTHGCGASHYGDSAGGACGGEVRTIITHHLACARFKADTNGFAREHSTGLTNTVGQ